MQRTLPTGPGQDNRQARPVPVWFVMTDDTRLSDPEHLIEHLPPSSAIIVRSRDTETADTRARQILPKARQYGVLVLVSTAKPPAVLVGDGLHIPEKALSAWKACDLSRLKPKLVTASAHSLAAASKAERFGADAILLSPVFTTNSHPGAASLGLMRFSAIANRVDAPIIALGGMTDRRIRRSFLAGAYGIAGIDLFAPS